MKDNLIKNKSFEFSLHVIDLYQKLTAEKEFILSKQLLRAATGIGANVVEAEAAQSKADFIAKLSIASKEARETKYWLQLLQQSDLTRIDLVIFPEEIDAIIRIITSIVKTTKENINNPGPNIQN